MDPNRSSLPAAHWDHIPATNPLVKWWAFTRRSGTRRFHPWVAGRQVSPREKVTLQDTRDSGPSDGCMATCPISEKPTAKANVNKIQSTQRKTCPSINDPLYLLPLTENICNFLLRTTYSVGIDVSAKFWLSGAICHQRFCSKCVQHQAINWISFVLLPIGHIGTNVVRIPANIRKLPLNKENWICCLQNFIRNMLKLSQVPQYGD